MRRFSKALLYGHQLTWAIERDRLDASFLRFGSGFITPNGIKEALECNSRINQILIQCQKIQELDIGILSSQEQLHPPLLMDGKSVPKYVHSRGDGNLQ